MTFEQICVGVVISFLILVISVCIALFFNWANGDETFGLVAVVVALSIVLGGCVTYICYMEGLI